MKFYNRETEIGILKRIEANAVHSAQMTMVLGRRRVGKTTLLRKAFYDASVLYFFIAKKNEILLCEEFVQEVETKIGVALGQFSSFSSLFRALMILSKDRHYTLVVDEFQEFYSINSSIYSEIQNHWDSYKEESKINIIFCGSVYTLMKKIFENAKEPLFGRATAKLTIRPFTVTTIKQILSDYYPTYSNEDLLAFYMVTGGIAKYIEQLVHNKSFTKKEILDTVVSGGSFFLDEGRAVLIDEFGRDYGNYFSVLSLIASSKTARSEIESILQLPVGGYLDRLEKDYGIIKRRRPFGAKESARNVKYFIEDNFLNFWFRFIYKYRSAVEIGNLDYVRNIIERDYETYSGLILERYFRDVLMQSNQYSDIGNYWDKRGQNEIDIVAVNDLEKMIHFYEVKRNPKKIDTLTLESKASEILRNYRSYQDSYYKLSLEDM
ncbi:MAG: ATP-binding protein [Saprospiraceae bacterium]|nr:ATP-binding protein [Saprospiraceae bacterium]